MINATNNHQIEVGWGYIYDNDLITMNFHMKFDLCQWKTVISLDKLSLFNNLQYIINNKQFEFPIVNINEKIVLINKLSGTKFVRNDILEIEYFRLKIEYWINFLMQFINAFDVETQNFIKENWFYSQVEYRNIFMNLLINDKHQDNIISDDSKVKKHSSIFHKFHLFRHKPKKDSEYGIITESALNNTTINKSNHEMNIIDIASKDYQKSVPELPVTAYKHVMKYAKSSGSDVNKKHEKFIDEMMNKTRILSALLKVEVVKGQQIKSGLHIYNVYLRVTGKDFKEPLVHRIFQRYSTFKKLYLKLIDINNEISTSFKLIQQQQQNNEPSSIKNNHTTTSSHFYSNFMDLITSSFPGMPLKSMIGLGLNKDELQIRTAALDRWFRDVCYHYRQMPSKARVAIRAFLNFDLSNSKDILIYDQLAWGIIDYHKIESNINKNNNKHYHNSNNQEKSSTTTATVVVDDNPIVLVRNSGLFKIIHSNIAAEEYSSSHTPSDAATSTISINNSNMDKLDAISSNTSKNSKGMSDVKSRLSLIRTYS